MNPARTNPFTNRKPLQPGGREVFLKRLRQSLGHNAAQTPPLTEPPPALDESLIRQCNDAGPALIDRWIAKAKTNSMIIHRTTAEPAAIHAALDASFAAHNPAKILLNAADFDTRFSLAGHLTQKSVIRWTEPNCRETAFSCDASITDCRAALADAGSLVVWSDASFGRSSTLVIPVHVILLPASRILPDLIDGLQFIRNQNPAGLPSNVVIINGPSKTADIEMNLITGVHGPKHVYVILIDGM